MHLVDAMMATRMLTMVGQLNSVSEGIQFRSIWWFMYASVLCILALFAGIMSSLTLGLMSLCLIDLEILQCSGISREKKQVG